MYRYIHVTLTQCTSLMFKVTHYHIILLLIIFQHPGGEEVLLEQAGELFFFFLLSGIFLVVFTNKLHSDITFLHLGTCKLLTRDKMAGCCL